MANGESDSCEQPQTPVPLVETSERFTQDDVRPGPAWNLLFQLARSGSDSAVGKLLDQCRGYLTVIALQKLGVGLRAKVAPSDIVQESLLEAFRGFDNFAGTSEKELLGWLRRILLNNLADARKRYYGTSQRSLDRERQIDANTDPDDPFGDVASQSALPIEKVIRNEKQQLLLEAIRRLPERQRRAVIMRNLESKSFSEIGEVLQISTDATRKLWERAIQRLFEDLKANDLTPPLS